MTSRTKRNVLLFGAIFALAAGALLRPHAHSPAPSVDSDLKMEAASHFAAMRSLRHESAEDAEAERRSRQWREALTESNRGEAFSKVIATSADAQLALRWAQTIQDLSARRKANEAIAFAWAKCAPEDAVAWARTVEEPIAHLDAIETVFGSWVIEDSPSACAYVLKLEQAEQSLAVTAVAPVLAGKDPASAMQWAGSLLDEDTRALATHSVVTTWAQSQPAEAAAWALTQPEGFTRADDVRTIVEKWFAINPTAAVEWVRALPQGASRDTAFDLVSNEFADSNPGLAANWAASIDRTELRDARLELVAGKWLNTAPDAARTWIETSDLPPNTKALLAKSASHAQR
jgi:hypothetical protein